MTTTAPVEFGAPHEPTVYLVGRTEGVKRVDGVWFGSTFVYPIGSRTAGDAWHSPFIAVGPEVVWRGKPAETPEEAKQAAQTKLAATMRALLASV